MIKGLYQKKKGGTFYYQPPTPKGGGARPKAVALGTRDLLDATSLAISHQTGETILAAESRDTMREVLPKYYAEKAEDTKKTRTARKQILGSFTALMGNPRVKDISEDLIREWRRKLASTGGATTTDKGVSPSTMTGYLIVLKAFLNWAVEKGMIRRNPACAKEMKGHTTVRVTRRMKFHSLETKEKILNTPCRDYIGLILHLGYFAGLREEEMLAFNPDWLEIDADFTRGSITVQDTAITYTDGTQGWWRPKDKEARTIPLHPRLLAFIKNYGIRRPYMIAPDKPHWPTDEKTSKRFDTKRAMGTHGRLCGEPKLGYHVLRRSFATHLSMLENVTVYDIAALLGNTPKVAQDHYIGVPQSHGSAIHKL